MDIDDKLDYQNAPFNLSSFDVIIMADIIEHLKDPLKTIIYFKKFLKKNGLLIISVPNIANIYSRTKLLLGFFDYGERGILDKTHLKFFTLRSFRMLIKNSGLNAEKEDVTPIPLPTIIPIFSEEGMLNFVHRINYLLAVLWRRMFGFQFIVYCTIKKFHRS